jgi:Mor family transcriptional regulator
MTARSQASYPEILEELADFLATTLVEKGLARKVADEVALAAVERVRENFGGALVYIPKGAGYKLAQRNAEIRRRLAAGESRSAIGRAYRLSQMQVGRIERDDTPIRR